MKVTYHGHSCVEVEVGGKRLIIDPFITHNPSAITKVENIHVDYIVLTHGHGDHVGDTVSLAKQNSAKVIAVFELATYLSKQGVDVHPMGLGGKYTFDFGTVKFTPAFHSSSMETENGFIYTGMPAGVLIMGDGKTLYHAGDTALFSDMKLIGERHTPDIAFLPIGDNFTMGPEDAQIAAEWVQAKLVIPMHFNTFSVIKQDAAAFVASLQTKDIGGKVLKPGESIEA